MWAFRLPSWVYFIVAPLGLAFAIYLFIDDQKDEAAKATARAGNPPAEVTIDEFDTAKNVGAAGEAVIVGQVDFNQSYELTKTKRGIERAHYVLAPIYPVDATDASQPALGVLMQDGRLSDEQIRNLAVGVGPFAPVLKIDGKVLNVADIGGNASDFAQRVKLTPNSVYIDPFENGRAAGLAPSSNGRDAAMLIGVVALVLCGFGLWRRSREQAQRTAEGDMI